MSQEPDNDFSRMDAAIRLHEAIHEVFEDGLTLQELCGISQARIEQFLGIANQFLTEKLFAAAADSFLFLCTVDPQNFEAWMGLGQAEQKLGRYDEALSAYCMASIARIGDPTPHIQAAQCYLAQNLVRKAVICLEVSVEMVQGTELQQEIEEQVLLIQKKIKKALKRSGVSELEEDRSAAST